MLKQLWPYSLLLILVFSLGAFFAVINHKQLVPKRKDDIAVLEPDIFAPQLKERYESIVLVDPEMAPDEIRSQVMHGYRIVMETQTYAKEYSGDLLNCRNCHFEGGNTLGGKNGSISLVGVSFKYPKYSERAGKTISLAERINNCFERSLNGKPLPVDGDKMKALLAYFDWISSPVKDRKEFPWLGLPKIVTGYKPNADRGKKVYLAHCAACHQTDGQGTRESEVLDSRDIPPLWGSRSFNRRAGMYKIDIMAPFVYLNMPFRDPVLTEEEALDVSQYIHEKPRE